MPHLQLEVNRSVTDERRTKFVEWAIDTYADVMETGRGHVAVAVRGVPLTALALGRVPAGDPVGVLNADVRGGRTLEQRETFADEVIERLGDWFDVPANHCYVIYTEHPGEDFLLTEGPLESWSPTEGEE